jgi:SAM-dependent methyltransferase
MSKASLGAADDAFGAALLSHLEGAPDDRVLILEVDDGRSMPAMPPAAFFLSEEAWSPWERELLGGVEGPVLDLGCGAGRHALFLQQQGLEVTGIDESPGAVEVCRRRGVRDVRQQDLRDPPSDKPWAGVLLMCGNFGLAGGWDETRELLRRLHAVCRPGALLVADSVDPTMNDDPVSVAYRDAKRQDGRYEGEVGLRLRFGDIVTPYWNLLNVAPSDVESLVRDTGWDLESHSIDGVAHGIRLRR